VLLRLSGLYLRLRQWPLLRELLLQLSAGSSTHTAGPPPWRPRGTSRTAAPRTAVEAGGIQVAAIRAALADEP
jgi:hypothetical protein